MQKKDPPQPGPNLNVWEWVKKNSILITTKMWRISSIVFLFLGHCAAAPTTPVEITDKRLQISQPERDLMDELCKISDSITSNVTTAADSNFSNKFNQSYELEPMMMEFDMYQGSGRAEEDTTAPDFDFESI